MQNAPQCAATDIYLENVRFPERLEDGTLLDMDALYKDPRLVDVYDALNTSREDSEFYISEMPSAPATLLDIGCGTGTLALQLAERGYAVTAVDPAAAMIQRARRKDTDQAVEWVVGYVKDITCKQSFDAAIMTGHAFQCILDDTDVAGLFDYVAQRLRPGGSFWFETRNPIVKPWLKWMPEFAGPPVDLGLGKTVAIIHEVIEVKDKYVTFEERYDFGGTHKIVRSTSTLRFLALPEIEALAATSGLKLSKVFGDWNRAPLSRNSPEIIVQFVNHK